ncbi:MAG: Rdx family protein [Deltaproteobacteria bacterium]|nr:Rdx family protein [Deltaproteobacteria bacterium]MCW8893949.1 Rdx family protein [Deltaproteobacteria bacterium]MCW9048798.1 Rdx family protein [Deltaproteobacteria bacterium]
MAASLATQLKERFSAEVELIESRGGAYEITVDGDLFFSKRMTGHFPNDERILQDLENH